MVVERVKDMIAGSDRFMNCGDSVFGKRFEAWNHRMNREIESIAQDLWAAHRLGLICESDALESIQWCKDYKRTIADLYYNSYEEKVGTEAYEKEFCEVYGLDYEEYKTL